MSEYETTPQPSAFLQRVQALLNGATVKQTEAEKLEARLSALAALWLNDRFAYERERKRAAKELNIRPAALDGEMIRRAARAAGQGPARDDDEYLKPVEPWSDPVDGKELLDDILDVLYRHVVLNDSQYLVAGLWVLHTYALDAADNSPILDVSSPTPRCGKTQFLETMGLLVSKPLPAANLTPALVFRVIDKYHPTLLIDEMDAFIQNKDELRGILNSGFNQRSAQVPRCVGNENEPKFFSTWTPKIFAHIGRIPATLEDRAIKIGLKRKLKDDTIERLPKGDAYLDLRRKCARWTADNFKTLEEADPKIPETLNDRAADSWRPLLAIADLCGFGKEARNAAIKLSEVEDDGTIAIVLLRDLADLFEQEREKDPDAVAMASSGIVTALGEMEGRKWPEYRNGKPITTTQLAALLKPFNIFPRKINSGRGKQVQGYRFSQFDQTFRRYLGEEVPLASLSEVKSVS